MSRAQRINQVFNDLRADNMNILDDFYDPKVEFVDPLGKHIGIESVKKYYLGLYKNVKSIRFEFTDEIQDQSTYVMVWVMYLKSKPLNFGKEVKLEGNSIIKFSESSDKVIFHRDYFDMGEFIYEHIPIVGSLIRLIKSQMKKD